MKRACEKNPTCSHRAFMSLNYLKMRNFCCIFGSIVDDIFRSVHNFLMLLYFILQVCKTMPAQHSNDMVVLISSIMEEVINESQANTTTVAFDRYASCLSLLIEGLKCLCACQAIDIRSIWKAVVVKVKVSLYVSLCFKTETVNIR